MVHAIVTSMNAVSLRKEGGVYFVPQAERHQIELAKELIASLPTSAFHKPYLLAIPVINNDVAKADVALAIHHGFLDELKALANKRDVPYQSLLKIFLAERIQRERKRRAS